jgi:hypothetical protein
VKKFSFVLAIVIALIFVGCEDSDEVNLPPYSVDLSTVSYAMFSDSANSKTDSLGVSVKNKEPLPEKWDGVLFIFSGFAEDVTKFKRITIRAKYFSGNDEEIPQADGNVMVVLVYDINGDLKGPEMGAGENTPLKEFNVGGSSGPVSSDKGSSVNLTKAPGGVLFQASDEAVKFIEITEVIFHNGSASGEK